MVLMAKGKMCGNENTRSLNWSRHGIDGFWTSTNAFYDAIIFSIEHFRRYVDSSLQIPIDVSFVLRIGAMFFVSFLSRFLKCETNATVNTADYSETSFNKIDGSRFCVPNLQPTKQLETNNVHSNPIRFQCNHYYAKVLLQSIFT